jgi:2-polyprenyl-6-methoxyphenol hydroxylase-like FAD-dependent oxidoreductase
LQAPIPGHPRGAALARLEHDVWMLTVIGLGGDHAPVRVEDFDRFAESVGSEDIQRLIRVAEPIDTPVGFRFPTSTRRYYERTRLPDNLVVLGDSLCSFNPVYGQGMSVAALEALTLARLLSERVPTSHVMMRALARIVDVPWSTHPGRSCDPACCGALSACPSQQTPARPIIRRRRSGPPV